MNKLSLLEIVSRYIDLDQGVEGVYFGHCPFHDRMEGKSFVVNEMKDSWRCFGCNMEGDAFDFIDYMIKGYQKRCPKEMALDLSR